MKQAELNRLYEKAKAEYLADIRNDNNIYYCPGCGIDCINISIHHIIKRSKLRYFYADKRNFMELCFDCHIQAESTIDRQKKLLCYDEMENTRELLLMEYAGLELYEQTLDFKYK